MRLSDFIGEATEYDKKELLEERKPKSWLKSVSAFANGVGGALIFGVSDNEVLVGLEDAKSVSEKISETIKTKEDCGFWYRRRRRICGRSVGKKRCGSILPDRP